MIIGCNSIRKENYYFFKIGIILLVFLFINTNKRTCFTMLHFYTTYIIPLHHQKFRLLLAINYPRILIHKCMITEFVHASFRIICGINYWEEWRMSFRTYNPAHRKWQYLLHRTWYIPMHCTWHNFVQVMLHNPMHFTWHNFVQVL